MSCNTISGTYMWKFLLRNWLSVQYYILSKDHWKGYVYGAMNWPVVTNEPVEFEKYLVDVQDFYQSFKRDLWNIPQINWENPKDYNVQLAGLDNTRILTDYAQNSFLDTGDYLKKENKTNWF